MCHSLWHILGCILPIAVILLPPLFGVSSGVALLVFLVAMFGCHPFMMRGHGARSSDLAGQLRDCFLRDLGEADEIPASEWARRSPRKRLLEQVGRALRPLI